MKDQDKTKEQLINELVGLRLKVAELEAAEIERKRAEEALRESEEKYRTLVEQSLQGLVIVQDFRIVFANTAFAEIPGYTVEELLSLSPEEVQAMIHPADQALVWGRFRDRLAGKVLPPRYEYRGIGKDGTVRWLEMFASRIEYGEKPAIQGAVVDITERKRAEEELAFKGRIVHEANDAIFTTANDSDFTITSWNPGAEEGIAAKVTRGAGFLACKQPGKAAPRAAFTPMPRKSMVGRRTR